ncbi:MAG: non-homologous end-joining DNA ligase [Acidimicrobiales bacterium]
MGATDPNAPSWIPPMQAVSGDLPEGEGWAFELKWDGMRIHARCEPPDAVTLTARSGRNVTSTFPELAGLAAALGVGATLDGEVVIFDHDRPSFERLGRRMHVSAPTPTLVAADPVVYMIFDLLVLDGRSLLDLTYRQRRGLLDRLIEPAPRWRVPPADEGDGERLLAIARDRSLEGVVAKRLDSPYRPGTRSDEWRKVKLRTRQEFVVGGWLPGQGRLTGDLGSLLLGVHDDGLRFVGAVGSGIGDRDRALLRRRFTPTEHCPFADTPTVPRPPVWVEPTVVVEVAYGAWPRHGHLRHPTYLGLCPDHRPDQVVRE